MGLGVYTMNTPESGRTSGRLLRVKACVPRSFWERRARGPTSNKTPGSVGQVNARGTLVSYNRFVPENHKWMYRVESKMSTFLNPPMDSLNGFQSVDH